MSDCTTCKENILSQTPSLIGQTQCNSDCPEEITCEDIIASNCVFYSGSNLSCSGINYGDTLTTAIQAINNKLCDNSLQCHTWTELTKSNLGLASTWVWAQSGFEKPAVSNVINCIVRLAGTITRSVISSSGNTLIGTLPSGKRPNNIRRFSVVFTTSSAYPLNIIPSFITILTNGEMYLNNPYSLSVLQNVTVSLDGISFQTGTII